MSFKHLKDVIKTAFKTSFRDTCNLRYFFVVVILYLYVNISDRKH